MQAHFNGIYTKGMLGFRPALAQTVSGVFVNGANLIGVGGLCTSRCASCRHSGDEDMAQRGARVQVVKRCQVPCR
jgi:hypothetical protein